eukprot:TRINITY_DN7486_c0_g1_i1.p1 TRINITY_DN7486_c0_g1~~TRINITY_DN7486_c0_g1_i1.p1  ORF type:complete len:155 (-),score=43.21 TRINITY_DN7486_c0_g1_i1:86-550(-)
MIYTLYIFNRSGVCLYYEEWNISKEGRTAKVLQEEQKLMFGLLYSLKGFIAKTSPKPCETFYYFKTSKYKLHYFETPTGLKFVMATDKEAPPLNNDLKKIYCEFYVEYAIKNPLYKLNDPLGGCEGFDARVKEFIKNHPIFLKPVAEPKKGGRF